MRYNTTTEILSYGRRAILIPRMLHRQEQFLRASRLAKLGLVTMLRPDDVTAEELHASVTGLLSDLREPLVKARADRRIPVDGSARLVEWFREVLEPYTLLPGDEA